MRHTEIIESPKTAFVPENAEVKPPEIIWTSRTMAPRVRLPGQGPRAKLDLRRCVGRLVDAGKQLKADAIVDVHYEPIGFLTQMQAFAIKFK